MLSELSCEFEMDEFVSHYGFKRINIWGNDLDEEVIHLSLYHDRELQGSIRICPKKLLRNLHNLIETKAGNMQKCPLYEFFIDDHYMKIVVGYNEYNKGMITLVLWDGGTIPGFIDLCPEELYSKLSNLIETKANESKTRLPVNS